MARYRKNKLRADTIQRFGQEAGLPLFQKENEAVPAHIQKRLEIAPKSMAVATDTKKLARSAIVADQVRLGEKQQKVLKAFAEIGPASNEEVAHHLGWPINRVVGRAFELRQLGLVIPDQMRPCRITGEIVHTWRIK